MERLLGGWLCLRKLDKGGEACVNHVVLSGFLSRCKHICPDLAHATLKGAKVAGLIASRTSGLEFAEDVSTAAGRICLCPGKDLLPLPHERVFAGVSPVQDVRAFQWFPGITRSNASLIRSSCFGWKSSVVIPPSSKGTRAVANAC
jgi:hypothetical protein